LEARGISKKDFANAIAMQRSHLSHLGKASMMFQQNLLYSGKNT
jgi:hypothetical protein